jgi:outer membrane protein insertion porin family
LRGYPNNSLTVNAVGDQIGATHTINSPRNALSYNIKSISIDIRISVSRNRIIFADFKSYNPFALSRSAGVGLGIYACGLLGIDFGHGFDAPGTTIPNGWETHSLWTTILGLPKIFKY